MFNINLYTTIQKLVRIFFIQQGCNKLIKNDNKDIYSVKKRFNFLFIKGFQH